MSSLQRLAIIFVPVILAILVVGFLTHWGDSGISSPDLESRVEHVYARHFSTYPAFFDATCPSEGLRSGDSHVCYVEDQGGGQWGNVTVTHDQGQLLYFDWTDGAYFR